MKKGILQALAAFLVLTVGAGLSYYLVVSRPRPRAVKRPRAAFAVRVLVARPRSYTYTVETTGTVVAPRRTELAAEVAGRIIYVSPRLLPGAVVERGEVLVRIDPTDYRAAVSRAEAELAEAERALAELSAEAERSVAEWRTLHPEEPPPPLVAKTPELSAARARVRAARAALTRARADLARTEIRAPYRGRVLEAGVEVGGYASPGRVLAVLYPVVGVEVYAPVADYFLPYLRVPGFNASGKTEGSRAEVVWKAGDRIYRYRARVVRAGGAVEEKTRLFPLYLRLEDPPGRPPLLPNTFVTVRIFGSTYPKVFVLPREALHRVRGEAFVWVVGTGERLERRRVRVLQENEDTVVVLSGLKAGDRVVAQRLSGATEGALVKVVR
ncbi:efflux RND transporter periplasmic adaptor subunit [Thermosulfurimonas sp. F29]|uniref:efflux RND transporter periplasmic adaptor subunit n=1 Tax=Thermosulfurimonas sp. F29 TaxID=2867247 RepID=UPI001C831070|nr:efflux RND transporter periplasmic adaptor subunit [Thermosulfurimonas sp. F29]MBX6423485.1 efflux RND transporter periplasmic adaptor subunit [Thermosulfurimonas sp. F29]